MINIKGIPPQIKSTTEASFAVNGSYGKAHITLNSYGKYSITPPVHITEATVRRSSNYKNTIENVTMNMITSYDNATKIYTDIAQKMNRVFSNKSNQEKLGKLKPQKYVREKLTISKPNHSSAMAISRQEAEERVLNGLEKGIETDIEHLSKTLDSYWQDLHAYKEVVENTLEQTNNSLYYQQYLAEKESLENIVYGAAHFVEQSICELMANVESPEDLGVNYKYNQEFGIIEMEVIISSGSLVNIPMMVASTYSTGKISIKDKAKKDIEKEHTTFYAGIGFYIASLMFGISGHISKVRISMQYDQVGIYWVEFDRIRFAKISKHSLDPIYEITLYPHVFKMNTSRNFIGIQYDKFTSQVEAQIIISDTSQVSGEDTSFIISIQDAELLCANVENTDHIMERINKIKKMGGLTIPISHRYEKILMEVKQNHGLI